MTRSQVRYLLGTPMVPAIFDKDRWDYLYYFKIGQRLHKPDAAPPDRVSSRTTRSTKFERDNVPEQRAAGARPGRAGRQVPEDLAPGARPALARHARRAARCAGRASAAGTARCGRRRAARGAARARSPKMPTAACVPRHRAPRRRARGRAAPPRAPRRRSPRRQLDRPQVLPLARGVGHQAALARRRSRQRACAAPTKASHQRGHGLLEQRLEQHRRSARFAKAKRMRELDAAAVAADRRAGATPRPACGTARSPAACARAVGLELVAGGELAVQRAPAHADAWRRSRCAVRDRARARACTTAGTADSSRCR